MGGTGAGRRRSHPLDVLWGAASARPGNVEGGRGRQSSLPLPPPYLGRKPQGSPPPQHLRSTLPQDAEHPQANASNPFFSSPLTAHSCNPGSLSPFPPPFFIGPYLFYGYIKLKSGSVFRTTTSSESVGVPPTTPQPASVLGPAALGERR